MGRIRLVSGGMAFRCPTTGHFRVASPPSWRRRLVCDDGAWKSGACSVGCFVCVWFAAEFWLLAFWSRARKYGYASWPLTRCKPWHEQAKQTGHFFSPPFEAGRSDSPTSNMKKNLGLLSGITLWNWRGCDLVEGWQLDWVSSKLKKKAISRFD